MEIIGIARLDKQFFQSELTKSIIIEGAKKRIANEIGNYLADHLDLITFEETQEDTPYTIMMKGYINII